MRGSFRIAPFSGAAGFSVGFGTLGSSSLQGESSLPWATLGVLARGLSAARRRSTGRRTAERFEHLHGGPGARGDTIAVDRLPVRLPHLARLVVVVEVPDVSGALLPGFQNLHLSRHREGCSLRLQTVREAWRTAPL